jgi:hypothetical protein
MKQKKDVQQGTPALMTRAGRKLLEAERRDWEQTAAIIARFFQMKAGEVKAQDLA